jgi:SAM-dependent methyltransferase
MKPRKLARVRPLLKPGLPFVETPLHFDFLTDGARRKYRVDATDNVSSHEYDRIASAMLREYREGLILDCGAGRRPTYQENVVNFEIVPYDTTDVVGVGEELPFRDDSFDAVFSLAVLEHVKDPFACAAEIARVMKPGARLYCVVPFLQPVHAYPHHYFNMTREGLRSLFDGRLEIEKQEVLESGLPIWTLTWILRSWREGLPPRLRGRFDQMKVGDLIGNAEEYLREPFVTALSGEKNFELASTTAILAVKPKRRPE